MSAVDTEVTVVVDVDLDKEVKCIAVIWGTACHETAHWMLVPLCPACGVRARAPVCTPHRDLWLRWSAEGIIRCTMCSALHGPGDVEAVPL